MLLPAGCGGSCAPPSRRSRGCAGGKSLTYQLPAVLSPGLTGAAASMPAPANPAWSLPASARPAPCTRGTTCPGAARPGPLPTRPPAPAPPPPLRPAVVVTPLLSLMQDQVQALNGLPSGGVPATYLSSQQSEGERQVGGAELRAGRAWKGRPRGRVPGCLELPHAAKRSVALRGALPYSDPLSPTHCSRVHGDGQDAPRPQAATRHVVILPACLPLFNTFR